MRTTITADMKTKSQIPKSFTMAAHVLKQMSAKRGSLNSLITEMDKRKQNIKLIYALVIKTIQNLDTIEKMIQLMADNDQTLQSNSNPFLTQILVADLIYGKHLQDLRKVSSVQHLIKFENKFKELLNSEINELKAQIIVRYIRVNLIKTSLKKMVSKFMKNGFNKVDYDKERVTFDEFKKLVIGLKENEFMIDYHFEDDLLVFHINSTKRLQQMKTFKESKIIMQDKVCLSCLTCPHKSQLQASLIAVECLDLRPGMAIMDVCCAPGMKTTAIASRLKNNGKLYSLDKSRDRIEQMHEIVVQNGVICCQIQCKDFTDVRPEQYPSLDAILLDPSCSGSGMNKRIDYKKDGEDIGRLNKLASFQTRMLTHAMSFGAKKLVYSTCSLSEIENESVVNTALSESPVGSKYKIRNAFPDWPIRGFGDYEFASKCIRSDAQSSLTNGFFVCVFDRIDSKRGSNVIENEVSIKSKKKRLK